MQNEKNNKFVAGLLIGVGIGAEIIAIISLVEHFTEGNPPAFRGILFALMGIAFIIAGSKLRKQP